MPFDQHKSAQLSVQGRLLLDPTVRPELGWLTIADGRIVEIGTGEIPRSLAPPAVGGRERLVIPAFTDAHIHLPQIESVGCDGMELLDWLRRVIFPAEEWWGRGKALSDTATAVRRMLAQGTAGFAGYLTSHAEPAFLAASFLTARSPMRFVVGRVAMDREAPDTLTAEDRDRAAQRPVRSPLLSGLDGSPRHQVSVNPRFAVSCSEGLLAEVGWIVRERAGLFVQTHLAETRAECAKVASLFPTDRHYTGVYDRFGLLTEASLLAHCVHLSDEEWRLIAERKSIVVHCPGANTFLQAGMFDLPSARRWGVRLALGSDVAAGPDIAMPRVARAMIDTAKSRAMGGSNAHIPTPAEAWTMITRTNAALLGWPDAGVIQQGAHADLLVLRTPEAWNDEHLVGRLIYNWSSDLIEDRVIAGRVIDPSSILPVPC